MTKLLNYLWRGWMIIIAGILLIIFFVPVYILSFRKEHYKYAYFFVRLWCKGIFYGMGFRYELIKLTDKKIDKDDIKKCRMEKAILLKKIKQDTIVGIIGC